MLYKYPPRTEEDMAKRVTDIEVTEFFPFIILCDGTWVRVRGEPLCFPTTREALLQYLSKTTHILRLMGIQPSDTTKTKSRL